MADTVRKIERLQQAAPAEAAITTAVASCTCPHCGHTITFDPLQPVTRLVHGRCPHCAQSYFVPGCVDEFVLLERIRTGSTGNLYRAQDLVRNSMVAIRFLPDQGVAEGAHREKLQAELLAFIHLNNIHLARVFDLRIVENHSFIIMELVVGETAEARLKRLSHLPESEALRLARDIADGMAVLHKAGLIHGNITPNNVVIGPDGISRLASPGLLGIPRHDARGGVYGTPLFIAPEVLKRAPDTPRSDVYSFGVMLYQLLTGQQPFEGKTVDDVFRAQMMAVAFPVGAHEPTLSHATRELVRRAMKLNPEDRYADGQALGEAVRAALALLEEQTIVVPEPRAPRPAAPVPVGKRLVRPVFVYAALAVIVSSIIRWQLNRNVEPSVITRSAPVAFPPKPFGAVSVGAVATCIYPLQPIWHDLYLGASSQRGVTFWNRDGLMFSGVGDNIDSTRDNCRYICTTLRAPYVISVVFNGLTAENPAAKAGILTRASMEPGAPAVFFGCTADGNLLLMCRSQKNAEMQIVRSQLLPNNRQLPIRLRLECNADRFRACVAYQGMDWRIFGYCQAAIPWRVSRIGVAVASDSSEKLASVEFSEIRVLVPFQ